MQLAFSANEPKLSWQAAHVSSSEKVKKLVSRLAPAGICDKCLATTTGLTRGTEASALARQLPGTGEFERSTTQCCLCSEVGQITRKAR